MSNPAGSSSNPFRLDDASYHSESAHSFPQQQLDPDLEVSSNLDDGLLSLLNSYEDSYQAGPAFDFSLQPHDLLIPPGPAAPRPHVISTPTHVRQPADRTMAPQPKIKWSERRVCRLVEYICDNPEWRAKIFGDSKETAAAEGRNEVSPPASKVRFYREIATYVFGEKYGDVPIAVIQKKIQDLKRNFHDARRSLRPTTGAGLRLSEYTQDCQNMIRKYGLLYYTTI